MRIFYGRTFRVSLLELYIFDDAAMILFYIWYSFGFWIQQCPMPNVECGFIVEIYGIKLLMCSNVWFLRYDPSNLKKHTTFVKIKHEKSAAAVGPCDPMVHHGSPGGCIAENISSWHQTASMTRANSRRWTLKRSIIT